MDIRKQLLFQYLDSLNITHSTFTHKEARTVEEWDLHTKEILKDFKYVLCKNLFLRSKKNGKIYHVVANESTAVNLNTLSKQLKLGSGNLRFASDEILKETLGLEKGAVTPLALYITSKTPLEGIDTDMAQKAKEVTVIIDKKLLDDQDLFLAFHPLTNDQTTLLKPNDFKKFLDNCENTIIYHDF